MSLSADLIYLLCTDTDMVSLQLLYLRDKSPTDCMDRISKEQFWLLCERSESAPGPAPPACGSSVGSSSFLPAPCMLQHRRGCLAAWVMLAFQAAVPYSIVGELPDRLQDYRTGASYLKLQS